MEKKQHYATKMRHQQFANEYIKHDFNGTKAYKAVYDPDGKNKLNDQSAAANACELLKDTKVKELIEKAMIARQKRMSITKDAVSARYNDWAGVDLADVVKVVQIEKKGKYGETVILNKLVPKDLDELTPEQRSAMNGYQTGKDCFKYLMVDKKAANDMLAKHLGIDKLTIAGDEDNPLTINGKGLSGLLESADADE